MGEYSLFPFFSTAEICFAFLSRNNFIQKVLCGNVLSALVSAALQYVSAALGRHSLAESVDLASLSLLGLIGSLHGISPLL